MDKNKTEEAKQAKEVAEWLNLVFNGHKSFAETFKKMMTQEMIVEVPIAKAWEL
jgi:hypothetical protein